MKRGLVALALLTTACVGSSQTDDSAALAPVASVETDDPVSTGPATTTSIVGTTGEAWSITTTGDTPIAEGPGYVDVTAAHGLIDPLIGMHGHAAAWGDVDGDGVVDLVVGTFADRPDEIYRERGATGPSPDRLLLSRQGGFIAAAELGRGRSSGAVFADLDGDQDQDLVLSRNVKNTDDPGEGTRLFENVDGSLVPGPGSSSFSNLGGRSIGVFDENSDGLLDLFIVEDRYAGGSSRLYRNEGDLVFVDVTRDRGLPDDLEGLGVAAVDLDGDDRTDLFVSGSNRLFLGVDDGFVEVDSSVFAWETFGEEDLVAGVASGDIDRDGRLDLVVGHHFNSTIDFGTRVPVRVYLNRSEPGELRFVDVTDAVGMPGLPTKAPHVEVVDLDNDGWPDILTSASAANGTVPAVFMHQGMSDGVPRFLSPPGLGSSQYWVTAPTADFDLDLRLDVLAVEWKPSLPSLLLRNEQQVGNAVRVEPPAEFAIGSKVWVFDHSKDELIGYQEIVASVGYTAGTESVAHFGLGDRDSIDLVVRYTDGRVFELDDVPANSIVAPGR